MITVMEHADGLKLNAKEAKRRFRSGYWGNFCRLKEERLSEAIAQGKNSEEVATALSRMARNDIKAQYKHQSEDDILYAEVCELLSSNEIILNPIKRLIDEEVYSALSPMQQEDYIMRLSLKFQEMRERYEREKIS